MKKQLLIWSLALLCVLPLCSHAFTIPAKPNSYILDQADILPPAQEQSLSEELNNLEKQTGNEIAVVTLKNLQGDTVENVAQEIFTAWGIGKKDLNNGVLLLVSLEDRRMRIHVGYGLEPTLTDITAYHIEQDVIVPKFKNNDYVAGIIEGVHATDTVIRDPSQAEQYTKTETKKDFSFFLFGFFFVFMWLGAILSRSKSWWAGGVIGFIVGVLNIIFSFIVATLVVNIIILVGLTLFGSFFDYIVSKGYQKNKTLGRPNPWWIGGGGNGFGGGGFGGFGGGSSGGGGASSSW